MTDLGDSSHIGTYLYWIPLGAGGSGFVRMNGRVYEWVKARVERQTPLELYHTALVVVLPEGRFVVETTWPSPDRDTESRGVVMEASVFTGWLSFTRIFRYEVRCWRDGTLPDADQAVGGAQMVNGDPDTARAILRLSGSVPALTWGRKPDGCSDMWNSNSVVSWLLVKSGVPMAVCRPPTGGRAPGWEAGIVVAERDQPPEGMGAAANRLLRRS